MRRSSEKRTSKVQFQDGLRGAGSDELIAPTFDLAAFEQIVQAKVEQALAKRDAADGKKEDRLGRQIAQIVNQKVEARMGESLDAKVCQKIEDHIGRHEIDPTLVALIKNFVPGMR